MPKISFGNIVKINASENAAKKAFCKLNDSLSGKQPQGRICTYSFGDSKDKTYIFTGKEADDFWKSYSRAWDEMDDSYAYYGRDDLAFLSSQLAWEVHMHNVQNIINSYPNKIPEIDCKWDNQNELTSVNIII